MDKIDNNFNVTCNEIRKFFASDKKCMLVCGTDCFQKHKIIVRALDTLRKEGHFLFRTNAMQNIPDTDFMGWAGIKKTPAAGACIRIHNNYYEFDSMMNSGTRSKTSNDFDCAIIYPVESILCRQKYNLLDELFRRKRINKIFLVTNNDEYDYDYSVLKKYADCSLTINI